MEAATHGAIPLAVEDPGDPGATLLHLQPHMLVVGPGVSGAADVGLPRGKGRLEPGGTRSRPLPGARSVVAQCEDSGGELGVVDLRHDLVGMIEWALGRDGRARRCRRLHLTAGEADGHRRVIAAEQLGQQQRLVGTVRGAGQVGATRALQDAWIVLTRDGISDPCPGDGRIATDLDGERGDGVVDRGGEGRLSGARRVRRLRLRGGGRARQAADKGDGKQQAGQPPTTWRHWPDSPSVSEYRRRRVRPSRRGRWPVGR